MVIIIVIIRGTQKGWEILLTKKSRSPTTSLSPGVGLCYFGGVGTGGINIMDCDAIFATPGLGKVSVFAAGRLVRETRSSVPIC